jgi:hypothetical protein
MPLPQIEKQGFGARTISPTYDGVDQGVPLIHKFYTLFTGANVDHHINQLMVQPDGAIQDLAPNADPGFASSNPENGNLRVSFQDKEGQDEFFFNVLDHADTGEQRWFEAELHRLRGEALLALSSECAAEAETCWLRAIAIAREQSARLWELRAARDLAGFWAKQGRRAQARDLLAPVYGWFTEGFDTQGLKDARAMLDELA